MPHFVYSCFDCGRTYVRDLVRYLCPYCEFQRKDGEPLCGVLEVLFDYDYIRTHFKLSQPDWNLFSPVEAQYYPAYSVGNTPFFPAPRLADDEYKNIWIKYDGLNPSCSLKDRASFLVVAEAIRLGEEKIVVASTGNAASALAAVAAAAGKKAKIFVPKSAPIAKLIQMIQHGAEIELVEGTYDNAFQLSLNYTQNNGGLNRNTAYNPLTIEGKKTVGLEIFKQNGFQVPDAIIIPVGDGVIISGVYKAFADLRLAKLTNKMPRLICIQAEKSDAIHHYIQTGSFRAAAKPKTIADSISVGVPSNAHMAKRVVEKTNGFSLLVSDNAILAAQAFLARQTGIFAEPAAASTLAGLNLIREKKMLPQSAQIVLLITGHGLKDTQSAINEYSSLKITPKV